MSEIGWERRWRALAGHAGLLAISRTDGDRPFGERLLALMAHVEEEEPVGEEAQGERLEIDERDNLLIYGDLQYAIEKDQEIVDDSAWCDDDLKMAAENIARRERICAALKHARVLLLHPEGEGE